jgi:hypothetical protein
MFAIYIQLKLAVALKPLVTSVELIQIGMIKVNGATSLAVGGS